MAFRLAEGAVPCLDCEDAGEGKCDDHACDLDLIEAYRQMHWRGGACSCAIRRAAAAWRRSQGVAVARRLPAMVAG